MAYMRSEARQRHILTIAKQVFAARGFHAANISHICEAARIGRGTLYQYFANKRSVLTAILREMLDRVRALMELQARTDVYAPPGTLTPRAAIRYAADQLRQVLEAAFQDDATLRILLREAVGLDVDVEKIVGEIDDTLISIVERSLAATHRAGFTREFDIRAVATMVVGGVEKLALDALRRDAPIDLAKLAHEATALHAIGILDLARLKPEDT
jgi:AcrR family transcriptional regulator